MQQRIKQQNPVKTVAFLIILLLFLLFWMSINTFGQTNDTASQIVMAQNDGEKKAEPVLKPVLQNYKDVILGMTAKDVRDKLGKPESGDDQSIYYKFSGEESVQIALNPDKKVYVISAMYLDNNKAPKPADVFGADTDATPNADGSIYKMIRYPEAGYVVVYSRTAGNEPMVIVTMQTI